MMTHARSRWCCARASRCLARNSGSESCTKALTAPWSSVSLSRQKSPTLGLLERFDCDPGAGSLRVETEVQLGNGVPVINTTFDPSCRCTACLANCGWIV
eukprot:1555302-Rhodomonas_salina.2